MLRRYNTYKIFRWIQLSLLRQRVYALALGYEDLNDHETLRLDLAIQTAWDAPRNY